MGKRIDARKIATGARGVARAVLAAALVLSSGTAVAGGNGGVDNPIEGSLIDTCGHWIVKLDDFGKRKLNDYNSYVPENLQTVDGPIRPRTTFAFGPDNFVMLFSYPSIEGVLTNRAVTGTYAQNGRKLKLALDAAGVAALEATFIDLTENLLFGQRELVTDVTFAQQRKPNKMKWKGRVRGDGLKMKFKAEMVYDIQFQNQSEYPDTFGASGRLKWRATTEQCPNPPPP